MKQSTAFLRGEGDRFYRRNIGKPRLPDMVLDAIRLEHLKPRTVLEVGCGNGWRLKMLRDETGSICYGIDPSKDAINDAPNKNGIKCWRGTADNLRGVADASIDMLIYAFCLYLVDREDLFKISCEGDRVLRNGGYLVIHDFFSGRPYYRDYEHADGVASYKQDYSKLWLGNPAYSSIRTIIQGTRTGQPRSRDDQVAVQILKKNIANGWPRLEYPVNMLEAG